MSSVIQVENLSKLYRLGEVSTGTISHDLNRWWHKVRGKEDPYLKIGQENDRTKRKAEKLKSESVSASQHSSVSAFSSDYVYALKEINFSVNQGEVLGIIGRNGAGKSTLLKILSRVTAPTSGQIKVKGRIASLLEVGTGFHPELTGRENIYLNGAILGMRRHEIMRKLDEIVDFSGCAAYLDTPVKRYSSGMYVRLAFAVAAHLESEILILDEVLAVGDAEFQKKCLGKMQDASTREGRTVLFVSHNLQAVSTLCTTAIVFQKGEITDQGLPRTLIASYLSLGSHDSAEAVWTFETAPSSLLVKLHSVKVCRPDGSVSYDHCCGSPITLSIEFWCLRKTKVLPSFHLYNESAIMVFPTGPMHIKELGQKNYEPGLYCCSCIIPEALLNTGTYSVHAYLSRETDGQAYVHVPDVVSFKVINDGTGMGDAWTGVDEWPGVIRPLLPWTSSRVGELALTT